MLFKEFKSKIICFFEVMVIVWNRVVVELRRLELDVNKIMQCLSKAISNINVSFNASEFNTLCMEKPH